jgi:hypothetical protein
MDDLFPPPTPDELHKRFRIQLKALGLSVEALTDQMIRLGDYRKRATILKSLQRMESGEITASGEIFVILRMLAREVYARKQAPINLEWSQFPDGSYGARTHDFIINLYPKSRGRWLVNLVHIDSGYSPPWPSWQESIENAKQTAVNCLYSARADLQDHEFFEALQKSVEA